MAPAQLGTKELLQLAAAMRRNVRIKDRRYIFRSYRRCFVGQEAVDWLVASGAASCSSEAVRLGNRMMEMGLFHHVVYEHLFEDDYLFYRFTDDDAISGASNEVAAAVAPRMGGQGGGPAPPEGPRKARRSLSAGGLGKTMPTASAKAAGGTGGLPTSPRVSPRASPHGDDARAAVGLGRPSPSTPASTNSAAAAAGPPGTATDAAATARSGSTDDAPRTDGPSSNPAGAPARGSGGAAAAAGPAAAAAATSEGPSLGGLLLLSEPRQDRSRQVLAGHLQALQGRVTHMSQAADAQKAIVDILVSEVSSLRGVVSELTASLQDMSAQLRAANAAVAHGSQQVAGLRLLTLGICACLLQQAVMNWLASGGAGGLSAAAATAGGGSVVWANGIFSGGMPCWGVALAVALTLLSLAVVLPMRGPAPSPLPAATAAPAPHPVATTTDGTGNASGGEHATDSAHGTKAAAAGLAKTGSETATNDSALAAADGGILSDYASANEGGGAPDAGGCSSRASFEIGSSSRIAAPSASAMATASACTSGATSSQAASSGATTGRSSCDMVRRCTEVARLLTAPARLHLPGKHQACSAPGPAVPPPGAAPPGPAEAAGEGAREGATAAAGARRRTATAPETFCAAAVGADPKTPGATAAVTARVSAMASLASSDLSSAASLDLASLSAGLSIHTATAASATDGGSLVRAEATAPDGAAAAAAAADGGPLAGGDVRGGVATPRKQRQEPRAAVPRPSDFEAWPDAPVLLAFDVAAAPEQVRVAESAPASNDSALVPDGSVGRSGELASKSWGPTGAGAHEVTLRVTPGGRSPDALPDTTAISADTRTASARASAARQLKHCASAPGMSDPARGSSPSPPLTPTAASSGGAPRPFASPTAGLVRLTANGLRPIRIETDLFSGELAVWVRGLATTPERMFTGKKRMSWVAMQGRFKVPLTLDSVVTGQEFARPFKRLPAAWFVEKVLLSMARQVSSSMRVGPLSRPCLTMPIIAAAQLVNVSKPGCQPPMMECREDVRLFCPRLSAGGSRPASADTRRRHFSAPRNRAGLVYDTEHVWTFHFWQQFVDLASYKLDFGYTYDLVQHLDGQPLQVMAKDEDSGKYLYNVLIWHERLLPSAHAAAAASGGSDPRVGRGGGFQYGEEECEAAAMYTN